MADVDHLDDLGPDQRALVMLRRLRERLQALEAARREPIAITGMACRFPGGASDPDAFWDLLERGTDAVGAVPAGRWEADMTGRVSEAEEAFFRLGAFLEGIDRFDPMFFGISPRQASVMDPQHRLLLEVAHDALEDAGEPADRLAGSRTGVFVGIYSSDYAGFIRTQMEPEVHTALADSSFAAGHLAYVFDLAGPCVAVNTVCSASLVAFHLAIQSLRGRESDLALAGGVNLLLDPVSQLIHLRLGALGPGGRCRAFDAAGDGLVRGEGCGVVVLKRLEDALAAGDRIHAVVRGTATNHDGRGARQTAPSGAAQVAVIRDAVRDAGIPPERVGYIQAHGTGTPIGDPIEVDALREVYGAPRAPGDVCALGSVKTNVGHLEAAAGIAGVIAMVQAMRHGRIPPHVHFRQLNPHIVLDGTPFVIAPEGRTWERGTEPRLGAVSSFGLSGSNAHVILEQAPAPTPRRPPVVDRSHHLLLLSARTEAALRDLAQRWVVRARLPDDAPLADLAFSANTGRSQHSLRLPVVARDRAELAEVLEDVLSGAESAPGVRRAGARRPPIAFLFAGQGAQYEGMARTLYETAPVFRSALDRCAELLRPQLEHPLLDVISGTSGLTGRLDDTVYAQPALVSVQLALAELWASFGIEPDYVLGHSLGEYAAAHVAGVLSLQDVLGLVVERGRLMGSVPGGGAMWAVEAPEPELVAAVEPYGDALSIAAVNGPTDTVISGDTGAAAEVARAFEARGARVKRLAVSIAAHSRSLDPILDAYERAASAVAWAEPRIPVVSTLTGRVADGATLRDPRYWRRHLREPVRFMDGVRALESAGVQHFLEIGPNAVAAGMAARCVETKDVRLLASMRKGQEEWPVLLESAGTLWADGARFNAAGYDGSYDRRRVAIPTYPFQRQRYWFRKDLETAGHSAAYGLYERSWISVPRRGPLRAGRWLVTLDAGWRGAELALRLAEHGADVLTAAPAAAFQRTGERSFELDASSAEQWSRLLSEAGPLDGVVHMLATDERWEALPDAAALMDAERRILGDALALVQASQDLGSARPRVHFVTEGAQAVAAVAAPDPLQAGLWGFALSLRAEDRGGWGGLIDLEPAAEQMDRLAEELLGGDGEDMVALRNGERFVARLAHANPPRRPWQVPDSATWIITGGLGGLGLATARTLAGLGVRRLVLTGRSEPGELATRAVDALRADGVDVTIVRGDIGRAEDAARVVAEAGPQLHGVVHAAGVLDDGPLHSQSWDRFRGVLSPKVAGAFHLDRLTRQAPALDHFVIFSSLAGAIGSPYQAAYASANACLDALARSRAAAGLPGQTINWTAWSEVGLAARPDTERKLRAFGISPLSVEQGSAALRRVLCSRAAEIAVLAIDWDRYVEMLDLRLPLLAELVELPATSEPVRSTAPAGSGELDVQRLLSVEHAERAAMIRSWLTNAVAAGLRCRPAEIDPERPLNIMGLDSMIGMELRAAIENRLGLTVPMVAILDGASLATLSEMVLDGLGAQAAAAVPSGTRGA